MHLTAPSLRLLSVLLLCLVIPASVNVWSPVRAQTPPTEAALRAQIAENPGLPAPYLALARIYIEQGRFGDAEPMIANALALTRQRAADQAATPSRLERLAPDAIRVGETISEPRKIVDVAPVYPAVAAAAKISGDVILEVLIDEDGSVIDSTVLRSVQLLDEAAVNAVSGWKFTPTLLNGEPWRLIMTVTVAFRAK